MFFGKYCESLSLLCLEDRNERLGVSVLEHFHTSFEGELLEFGLDPHPVHDGPEDVDLEAFCGVALPVSVRVPLGVNDRKFLRSWPCRLCVTCAAREKG